MLALKVPLKKAEETKNLLIQKNILNKEYKAIRHDGFLLFPLIKKFKSEFETVEISAEKKLKQDTTEALKKDLTKEELEKLKTSFDIVGSIAILEIPRELEHKETIIAKHFLKHNIKTVLRKQAGHEGTFRVQKMKFLAGIDTKTTNHKENGVQLKVNVEEVYFSVRLSEERKRIASLIKKDEHVLVMFSGCAPYPIVFSKNTPASHIVGIEINPQGHSLGLENIKLNKIKNVDLYCGDVKEIVPTLKEKFDRIVMPLPKTADDFLDSALDCAKENATIHFYAFKHKEKTDEAIQTINAACTNHHLTATILKIKKVGQQSPNVYRICVDFQIEKEK